MIQYIDVGDIVQNLPETMSVNPIYNTRLEIDVCLLEEVTIESGGTRKLRTNIGICNIPDTHYVNYYSNIFRVDGFTLVGNLYYISGWSSHNSTAC